MSIFYLVFIIVIFLSIKKNKIGDIIIPLILFLVSIFRADSVGTDTSHYMDAYSMQWLANRSLSDVSDNIKYLELLYIYIVKIAYFLDSPRIIISCFSIITFIFLGLTFRRLKINFGIAFSIFLLLGFYIESLNYARQLTACAILLYSYSYYLTGNDKKYILYVLLASLFHLSSILFIFIRFIPIIKIKRFNLLMFIIGVFVYSIISPINIVSLVSKIVSIQYILRYEDLFMDSNLPSIMGIIFKIINFAIIIYVYCNSQKGVYADRYDIMFSISFVFSLLFGSSNPIIARIVLGASIFQVIYISRFFSTYRTNKLLNMMIYVLFACLNAYSVLSSIKGGAHEVIPYEFL